MIINKIYTYYFIFIFSIFFLITYPVQLVLIQNKKWFKYGHYLNKIMIDVVFFFCAIKVEIVINKALKEGSNYIFCANHTSYIDILAMYSIYPNYFKYLGKSSLEKIPLFGYMFKKLYISVNRRNKESRNNAYEECENSLKNNISIAIYPEGAIPDKTPQLIHFKDGAFKLSINNNTPIIPITMPYNYNVLPFGGSFNSRYIKIIIHEPLNTAEKPINSVKELKDKTFDVIINELINHGVIDAGS